MPSLEMIDIFPSGMVSPITGFFASAAGQSVEAAEHRTLSYKVGDLDDGAPPRPHLAVTPSCSILRIADKRYLQCELNFPKKAGWLDVSHDSVLIDRAELIMGWQNAAVDLQSLPPSVELALTFRDANGIEVEDVLIRALWASDDWDMGQRRRLKCYLPFSTEVVTADFSVYTCPCPTWLKPGTCAGNTRNEGLAAMWNGPMFMGMRKQFLAGDYETSCRGDICPVLREKVSVGKPSKEIVRAVNEGMTELDFGPNWLQHDIDYGCNIECKMCRNEKILPNRDNIRHAFQDMDDVVALGSMTHASMSGAGEVFIMADVVKRLATDYFSSRNISISITSNLTNFNKALWDRIGHNEFLNLCVSADGCSTEIYELVRVGAKWARVNANMEFLSQLKKDGKIAQVSWNYTVQRENVCDVAAAIQRSRELGFDWIRLIAQVGALNRTNGNMFEDNDVAALDRLYDQIESVQGFGDSHVLMEELGIQERRYRTVERRLELAEYVYDRFGFVDGSKLLSAPDDWRKCKSLVYGVLEDVNCGVVRKPTSLPPRYRNFIERFLETMRANEPSGGSVLAIIRRPQNLRNLYADRAFARQVSRVLGSH